jgi:DNA polymerase III epsilon subunit-like protein
MSDVYATLAMAKLVQEKQPKLFEFLFTPARRCLPGAAHNRRASRRADPSANCRSASSSHTKLEHLTQANGVAHEQAHDAMSDVYATLAMAKLVQGAHHVEQIPARIAVLPAPAIRVDKVAVEDIARHFVIEVPEL